MSESENTALQIGNNCSKLLFCAYGYQLWDPVSDIENEIEVCILKHEETFNLSVASSNIISYTKLKYLLRYGAANKVIRLWNGDLCARIPTLRSCFWHKKRDRGLTFEIHRQLNLSGVSKNFIYIALIPFEKWSNEYENRAQL